VQTQKGNGMKEIIEERITEMNKILENLRGFL